MSSWTNEIRLRNASSAAQLKFIAIWGLASSRVPTSLLYESSCPADTFEARLDLELQQLRVESGYQAHQPLTGTCIYLFVSVSSVSSVVNVLLGESNNPSASIQVLECVRPCCDVVRDEPHFGLSSVAYVTKYLVASTTVVRIRTVLRLSVTNGVISVFNFAA